MSVGEKMSQHVRETPVLLDLGPPPVTVTNRQSHLASLTSHFDGHGLLGADQVDDFLVGTGGDGVAIDADNLVPYLGTQR